eukprot:CAMPEP_0202076700 /NCGR_PEP_ID=MMETSP0964-20121228/4953_1 /ASSEMBLY_ACC=CAM_ASM_000500 /TAXON_ID=4773 /ORGANISM="Schizochytrium aggregatum, Strain ATCC28209" /LENGTH=95 /DNA_ID=CAMNT_0048643947 /DNA_START=35 /DNA_END=318 /DNA_ORIENTATION=-
MNWRFRLRVCVSKFFLFDLAHRSATAAAAFCAGSLLRFMTFKVKALGGSPQELARPCRALKDLSVASFVFAATFQSGCNALTGTLRADLIQKHDA